MPVTAIDDGLGGSLVWLTDSDANLWPCSADAIRSRWLRRPARPISKTDWHGGGAGP
jgi:hypothetical protein